MDNFYNNKTRILLILDELRRSSDEDHAIKADALLNRVREEGLKCDRKTLYNDIESLMEAGYDIIHETGEGYKLVSREFDDAELRLLADAVYSSRFISAGKTKVLLNKLKNQTSSYMASSMIRTIYSSDVKTKNEDILYNVDSISRAIHDNKMVEFEYLTWNSDKQLVIKGEKKRILSPWSLIWQDQNYYLLAYDDKAGKMKHFRVDKMRKVKLTDKARLGAKEYKSIDMDQYVEKSFGMYGGKKESITLDFPEEMIGIAIDRFGTDITVRNGSKGRVLVRTDCYLSNIFFGWVAGLGGDVKISAPKSVALKYKEFLVNTLNGMK